VTFSDCTYLSGVSTWAVKMTLVVLGCKGDYNTLRYQKNKKEIRQQRSKVASVSNQTYMYTVYIYVHISLDVSFDNNCGNCFFCQNPQVLDCKSILGVTSQAVSAGWPISQHRLGKKVNGCECRRESCECCCWLLSGSVFDTHWYSFIAVSCQLHSLLSNMKGRATAWSAGLALGLRVRRFNHVPVRCFHCTGHVAGSSMLGIQKKTVDQKIWSSSTWKIPWFWKSLAIGAGMCVWIMG